MKGCCPKFKEFDTGFKTRLNFLINEKGLSNKQLAHYIGVDYRTIGIWRSNKMLFPTLTDFKKLAKFFKVPVKWLMKGFI